MLKEIVSWAHELAVIFLMAMLMLVVAGIAAGLWPDDAETNNLRIGFCFGMLAWMIVEKTRK